MSFQRILGRVDRFLGSFQHIAVMLVAFVAMTPSLADVYTRREVWLFGVRGQWYVVPSGSVIVLIVLAQVVRLFNSEAMPHLRRIVVHDHPQRR